MHPELENLKSKGLLRSLKASRQHGARIEIGGADYLNFSSNDYLGIAARKDLQDEFLSTLPRKDFLFGSTASRLLTGNFEAFEALEDSLKNAYKKEAALVFNSGYHANTGILPALTSKADLILADKLCHASIIDGLRLGDSKFMRYAHNDLTHLEKLLADQRDNFKEVYIATESVFSMDGDTADLPALIALKDKYRAKLYVDEAHSFGVFGRAGLGLAQELDALAGIDILMGTLGKAAASEGAFALCDSETKELLVNKCRPLIFTTAIAPVNVLWSHFIFSKLPAMNAERAHLKNLQKIFAETAGLAAHSQIIPLVIGGNDECLKASQKLAEEGVWAAAVRHPTVPAGSARIRFSLSAALTEDEVRLCAQKAARIKAAIGDAQ